MTDHGEPADELISPFGQMFVVIGVALVFAFGGTLTTGFLSTALLAIGLIIFFLGSHRVLITAHPLERFEVGTFRAGHKYNGVTITADVEIQYEEDGRAKTRTVECAAVAENGTTIFHERDTEPVGEKPDMFGLVGGDFDGVRSTTDHILAVSAPVHEYVDEWLGAGGNDPMIKSTLETEFATSDPERNRAREET